MLAWTFAFNSNYDMSLHYKANGTNSDEYPNVVLNMVNNHHHIVYYAMKVPYPLQPRSFLCRGILKRTDEGKIVSVFPIVHLRVPIKSHIQPFTCLPSPSPPKNPTHL